MPPIIPAHGALGNLDEVVFLLIGIIFLGMMGISWFRSQHIPDANDTENQPNPSQTDHFELQ